MKVQVVESVLKANDAVARETRRRLEAARVLTVNLMSAPGSGKTALLEKTLPALDGRARAAVMVGDLQTTRDADRLAQLAAHTTQITTGGGCHLTATQVAEALAGLALGNSAGSAESDALQYLFVENVGNMVCPAAFDLGEHRRAVLLSLPEGDDKVAKYPTLFQPADVIILTKVDLRSVLEFDVGRVKEDLSRINTRAPLIELSARTGQGVNAWLDWLKQQRVALFGP